MPVHVAEPVHDTWGGLLAQPKPSPKPAAPKYGPRKRKSVWHGDKCAMDEEDEEDEEEDEDDDTPHTTAYVRSQVGVGPCCPFCVAKVVSCAALQLRRPQKTPVVPPAHHTPQSPTADSVLGFFSWAKRMSPKLEAATRLLRARWK